MLLLLVNRAGATETVAPAISVTVDADTPGAKINPFIYSQFIEHLGRCIYGGIWAEMLEDRKFYFPITDKYDPYRSLRNSEFPVVGASPWEVVGPAGSVTMIKPDAFVGEQTPQIAPGSGIRQNDLAVVAGKKYDGYLWLKSADGETTAKVALSWGDAAADCQTVVLAGIGAKYQKYPFQFTAGGDTDHARLTIEIDGAPCLIGTVSLMPADNVRGMRPDTLALLKQLNAPDVSLAGWQLRQRLRLARRHRRPRSPPAPSQSRLDRSRA